ncbi:MAG: FkbM family methyltransferase [candidate division WOR-3 bacterium]
MKIKFYIKILFEEKFSPLFLLSVLASRLKIKLPFKVKIAQGIFLYLHPSSIAHGLWRKKYSIEIDKLVIENLVKENFQIIDVGANIGHLSLLMAKKAKNGFVVSIEAARRIFGYFVENINLNKIFNILPLNLAISNENKIVDFFEFSYADDQSALKIDKNWKHQNYKILRIRLDELIKILSLPRVDFIKIDTEGAELIVIKSLGEFLSKVKYIYFEFNEENYRKFGYNGKEILNFLHENGFKILEPKKINGSIKFQKFEIQKNYSGNLLAVSKNLSI